MEDLSAGLTKLNPASQLFVVRGPPTTVLPELWKEWGITDIVWCVACSRRRIGADLGVRREKDDDPYTASRDAAIRTLAEKAGDIKVHTILGHTLYDSAALQAASKGPLTRAYGAFGKLLATLPKPALPLSTPTSLPDPGSTDLGSWSRKDHAVDLWRANDLNREWRETGKTERDQSFETFAGPKGDFAVPTMEELGMVATSEVRGGETRALLKMEEYLSDQERVVKFQKPKTSPAEFDPPSSESSSGGESAHAHQFCSAATQLSPHLKFGTLSPRTFYHRLLAIEAQSKKGHSNPPESLVGQLLWREVRLPSLLKVSRSRR